MSSTVLGPGGPVGTVEELRRWLHAERLLQDCVLRELSLGPDEVILRLEGRVPSPGADGDDRWYYRQSELEVATILLRGRGEPALAAPFTELPAAVTSTGAVAWSGAVEVELRLASGTVRARAREFHPVVGSPSVRHVVREPDADCVRFHGSLTPNAGALRSALADLDHPVDLYRRRGARPALLDDAESLTTCWIVPRGTSPGTADCLQIQVAPRVEAFDATVQCTATALRGLHHALVACLARWEGMRYSTSRNVLFESPEALLSWHPGA